MRKVLFSILLATTVATPALAQSDPADRAAARQERQAQREQARENRSQAREDRAQARDNRAQAREERVQVREERVQPRNSGNFQPPQQNVQVQQEVVRQRDRNVNERGRPTLGDQQAAPNSVSNWRQEQRDAIQQQTEQRNTVRQQRQDRRAEILQQQQSSRDRWVDAARSGRRLPPPTGARPDRPAPPPETAYNNRYPNPQWRTDWRNNHHYDWRNYRHHHRSRFHLGFYIDPFGWGYQRYGIGWRLWPSFYSSNYWLNDPGYYALPYAPWPYRWVRYYDDALLVNVYTGQVVDVIYDFFW